jgi:glycosyltransferase involved in cell wall biosynthesis
VVPNAVRETLARTADPRRLHEVSERYQLPDRFFLTIGADTPRRNYSRLIDAVAAALHAGQSLLPLIVVGAKQWAGTRVFQQAAARGTGDRVRFLSDVSDDDLSVLYSAASAYICPSIHEGFGMPVLEAMACGTHVVCSDLPVLHEVAGEAADYFCETDVDSIARSLLAASRHPALAPDRRGELAAKAHRFSWAASARTVRDLYERVLRDERPSPNVG